jgi:hypothetical protein
MDPGLLVALAAGALLLTGCGRTGQGDEEQIRSLVRAYVGTPADGDGERSCAMMTAERRANETRPNRDAAVRRCRDLATLIRREFSPEQLDELRRLRIGTVTICGDRARLASTAALAPRRLAAYVRRAIPGVAPSRPETA